MSLEMNLLVCGKTGSGKTTLIRELLGNDIVSEDKISHSTPMTKYFDHYNKESLHIFDSKGYEGGKSVQIFIDTLLGFVSKKNGFDSSTYIHNIIYCIDGSGARVTNYDMEVIRAFSVNVLVLITKSDITKYIEINEMIRELESKKVPRTQIIPVSAVTHSGIQEVEKYLHLIAPSRIEQAKKDARDEKVIASGIWAGAFAVGALVFKLLKKIS